MMHISLSNIVEGVIVAIIFWVLQKFGIKIVGFFSRINKSYSRLIHKEAAKGFTNKITVVMFYMIMLFFIVSSEQICLSIWDNNSVATQTQNSNPAYDKFILNAVGIIIVILNLFLVEFFSRQNVINRHIANFNHKLKIIRPIAGEPQYHLIQQKWAMMESEDDYKNIYKIIDEHLAKVEGYKPDKKKEKQVR